MPSFTSGNTAIRIDQQEPSTPGQHPAILLVHGSGGNVSFWFDRIAPQLTRLNLWLYAVHYFDRTNTARADPAMILDGYHFPTWLDTVADALTYIRSRPTVDPNRIALLGISLGAFLSLAVATNPGARVRAVAEISGGLPDPYAARAGSSFPPTLILHGSADQVVPVRLAHELDARLTQLSVPHETRIYPRQGHWFDTATQLQMILAMSSFLTRHL